MASAILSAVDPVYKVHMAAVFTSSHVNLLLCASFQRFPRQPNFSRNSLEINIYMSGVDLAQEVIRGGLQ
jgi:hypothetical protein